MGVKMDKPSWDNAPEWANYLARNSNGKWRWYQLKPHFIEDGEFWDYFSTNRTEEAFLENSESTLEERPDDA